MAADCRMAFWACLECLKVCGAPGVCQSVRCLRYDLKQQVRRARWRPTKTIQAAAEAAYILGGYEAVTVLYRETR